VENEQVISSFEQEGRLRSSLITTKKKKKSVLSCFKA
jgi:hypothetical protein